MFLSEWENIVQEAQKRDRELLEVLLKHAAYSFREVTYDDLTAEEKSFITRAMFMRIQDVLRDKKLL